LPARGQKVGGRLARNGSEGASLKESIGRMKGIASVVLMLSVFLMAGLSEAKSVGSYNLFSKHGTEAHTNSVRASSAHNSLLDDTSSIRLR
jgi:hypothetical protein